MPRKVGEVEKEGLYIWLRRRLVGTENGEGRLERRVIAHALAKKGAQGSKRECQRQRTQSESATEARALPAELSSGSVCVCMFVSMCMQVCKCA